MSASLLGTSLNAVRSVTSCGRQGAGELDAVPMEPAREAAERGRGMGHVRVRATAAMSNSGRRCSSNRRTTAGTSRSPAGWRDRTLRVQHAGDDGQGDGNRRGPVWRGDADNADDLLCRVCAEDAGVHPDAARLAAATKAAGSGEWPSSLATRTVTSYLPGGLFMPGTVSVICDIPGARGRRARMTWPTRLPSHGSVPRPRHGGHRAPHVPMLVG